MPSIRTLFFIVSLPPQKIQHALQSRRFRRKKSKASKLACLCREDECEVRFVTLELEPVS
jgi:hypothetical protein